MPTRPGSMLKSSRRSPFGSSSWFAMTVPARRFSSPGLRRREGTRGVHDVLAPAPEPCPPHPHEGGGHRRVGHIGVGDQRLRARDLDPGLKEGGGARGEQFVDVTSPLFSGATPT